MVWFRDGDFHVPLTNIFHLLTSKFYLQVGNNYQGKMAYVRFTAGPGAFQKNDDAITRNECIILLFKN
jgi:hypothetical protein